MNAQQEQVLVIRRFRAGTIVKLVFIGTFISSLLFGVIIGIAGVAVFLFGAGSVMHDVIQDEALSDRFPDVLLGTLALLPLGIGGIAVSAVVDGLMVYLGLRIWSYFKPLNIRLIPINKQPFEKVPQSHADDTTIPRGEW